MTFLLRGLVFLGALYFQKRRLSFLTSNALSNMFNVFWLEVPVSCGDVRDRRKKTGRDKRERGRESHINLRAMTKGSCAVKFLDSCRTQFPLWLNV